MSVDETPGLAGVISELRDEVKALRTEISDLRSPRVEIMKEPLTYAAHLVRDRRGPQGFRAISDVEPRSYIKDLVLGQKRGDIAAQARLERHANELRALSRGREALFAPNASYEFEQRTVNWATGTGGYSAPPLWIIDQFAIVPTPERVISRLAPNFELPVGAQSVNLPRWTAGAEVGDEQLDDPGESTDLLDSIVSSAVATIAGNEDVPLQMLEQSPVGAHLDWAVFTNMEARYGYQLEYQILAGNGPTGEATRTGNNQLLGLLFNTGIPAANIINYTGTAESGPSSPTGGATSMYPYLGLAVAKVGQARLRPPELWMMTTSRLGWIATQEDQNNRPLLLADSDGTGKFDLVTINVELNDAIPRTVSGSTIPLGIGAGTQEPIIACRPSDYLVLESDRHVQVMPDVLSGTMEVRLQMRRYVAVVLRQPTSVAMLVGSGMVVAGGY